MNRQPIKNGFVICSNGTSVKPDDLIKLKKILNREHYDIVIAGRLLKIWKNGKTKKDIVFEQQNNRLHPLSINPPSEPAPFLKERWNPFNSFYICKESVWKDISKAPKSSSASILTYAFVNNLKVFITEEIIATEEIRASTAHNLSDFIGSVYLLRKIAILISTISFNIKSYFNRQTEHKNYYKKIDKIRETGEIIVKLNFGGLGDCLSFSSLPRLLKEQYGVDFYLDVQCKNIFRHPDIFELCFGLNPFFKGFKESSEPFIMDDFIQDYPFSKIFARQINETAVKKLERQFNLQGKGLPEVFYQPKKIPNYKNTLFCDKNWYSGKRWGLYNDQNLLKNEISGWIKLSSTNKIEYCQEGKQSIFEYADKIYSAGKFLCLFSGGNALAAALDIPATVVVPENIEGTSLCLYLYTTSKINYVRNAPLDSYY